MSKSTKTAESEESGGTVRERKNVNMYLPEELVEDLQLRYSELNVEWRRQHGEDMPKNEEYYPAAIRAALGESSIEEELGVE
ncbi:HNH endonuclease [Halorubrum persicum]|uniref:HNH endonuclease n=2 Tax=Halorubrum persicum TaxID=1383844 RepID=A0A2G1WH03_9EURY|nr:HNH endonuclease [Halorubrum persicum]